MTSEIDAILRALISEHAPHGFAGSMRGPNDGCPVYVAAVALSDALAPLSGPVPAVEMSRAGLGAIVTRLLDEHWPNSGINGWYLTDLLRDEGVRVIRPAATGADQ